MQTRAYLRSFSGNVSLIASFSSFRQDLLTSYANKILFVRSLYFRHKMCYFREYRNINVPIDFHEHTYQQIRKTWLQHITFLN